MRLCVLLLAFLLTVAGATTVCPSSQACAKSLIPCNTLRSQIDPDLPNNDDDNYFNDDDSDTGSCLMVNCSGIHLGDIPCDLPSNTTFLLLANTGIAGNFSFEMLQQRVPSLFCVRLGLITDNCPDWVGVVDLSNNGLAGVATMLTPSAFWGTRMLNANIDLTGNRLTMLTDGAFASVDIIGSVDLSRNSMQALPSNGFLGANIGGMVNLSDNKITSVQQNTFEKTNFNGLNLRGNNLSEVPMNVFSRLEIANELDLSDNKITQIVSYAFYDTKAGAIDLTGNSIREISKFAFYGASVDKLNLQGVGLTALGESTFTLGTFGAINLADNDISAITDTDLSNPSQPVYGAFYGSSVRALNLSRNALTALHTTTFSGMDISMSVVDLSHNSISVLEDGWSFNFPLNIDLNMTSNPSVCHFGRLRDRVRTFVCACVDDSTSDILGNGAYCSSAPCTAPNASWVAHGKFYCPDKSYSGGSECIVVCDEGYERLDNVLGDLTCLGGIWGLRPNLAAQYPPSCYPGFPGWEVAVISVSSCALGLLIAGVMYLLVNYRKKIRRQEYDIELKEHLLSEQGEELDALRQVFTVPADEVHLEARIDSGAFGEVWRGRWNDLPVAVKRMRAVLLALDQGFAAEFEAETALMRRLRHANVVTFFGAGTDHDGMPFLVCELMANSLQSRLWHSGEAAAPLVTGLQQVKWARDAALGMAFLHAKGVIHRDLKSGNLLGLTIEALQFNGGERG